jgi:FkbM family methyltransferase
VEWLFEHVRPGDVWIDVGAHYGYTAIAMALLAGKGGRVLAFEPVLRTASHICETCRINRLEQVTVVPVGLTNANDLQMMEMAIVRGMAEVGGSSNHRETLLSFRLDWLWPRIRRTDERPNGVKIDVQGMELEVLEGMSETLRKHSPIIALEFHDGVSRPAVLGVLRGAGYHSPGVPIEPLPGEGVPAYSSNRSYAFFPDVAV